MKQYNKALADFTKIIELEPKTSYYYVAYYYDKRADLYAIMKQYDKAIEDYHKAIEAIKYYYGKDSQKLKELYFKKLKECGLKIHRLY